MRFFKKPTTRETITEDSVQRWKEMYVGQIGDTASMNLPAAISSELARLTTIELKVTLTGGEAAEFATEAMDELTGNLRRHTELCCALGGGMFRPYCDGSRLRIEFFPADRFEVTSFTSEGIPDGCIFFDTFRQGDIYFTRREEHRFENGDYIITNRAYKGHTPKNCVSEIPLSSVPRWQSLSPETVIKALDNPLFVYFKMPCVDNKSPERKLGASVFARAEDLIKEADRQLGRLLWEFEGGELAIDASLDALRINEKGTYELPRLSKRLFRGLGIDAGDRDLYSVFSPQLRDASIINGLNELLMRIEDTCSLARGTFSNASSVAKTATEIRILNQRSYAMVCDIQNALRTTLEGLCHVMQKLQLLYGLPSGGEIKLSAEFDDSIVTDRGAEFEEKLKLVQSEIMSKEEFRQWYFGESDKNNLPDDTPEK